MRILTGREIAIFDLDGTICEDKHRAHLAAEKRWDEYHAKCVDDRVRRAEEIILRATDIMGITPVFITGRNDKFRVETMDWFRRQGLSYLIWDDTLFMRPDGDFRPAPIVKRAVYDYLVKVMECRVAFVVEDQPRLVRMWRDLGLTCFQCQDV